MATLDVLGEDVTRLEETEETVLEYCRALDALAARRLDSNVSVKLTALGLKIDAAECRGQFVRILDAAANRRPLHGLWEDVPNPARVFCLSVRSTAIFFVVPSA